MKLKKVIPLLIIAAGFLCFYQCSKQEQAVPERIEGQKAKSHLITSIHRLLQDTEQQETGVHYKSDSIVPIDSAIYYIGATLNYAYCFPTETYRNSHKISATITLEMESESQINYDEVLSSYSDVVADLRTEYLLVSESDKHLIVVTIEDMGNNLDNSEREIKVNGIVGVGNSLSLSSPYGVFPTDLAYKYQEFSSKCDGTGVGTGAADLIESEFMFYHFPAPAPQYHVWYWPTEEFTPYHIDYKAYDPVTQSPDNYIDYYIYFASNSVSPITNETRCLEYDQGGSGVHELDFYLFGAEYIMDDLIDEEVTEGYSFISLHIASRAINGGAIIRHELTYEFGDRHVTIFSTGYPTNIE